MRRPARARRDSHRPLRVAVVALFAGAAMAACDPGRDGGAGAGLVEEREMAGDTLVVRTVAGSVWGGARGLDPVVEIGMEEGPAEYLFGRIFSLAVDGAGSVYVYDGHGPDLRQYDPDGTYVRTFGRAGEGPGEHRTYDGGIAVLRDGRVVLRDNGNARFQLWAPDGREAGSWPLPQGALSERPLAVDSAGFLLADVADLRVLPPRPRLVLRFSPHTGELVDTIPLPPMSPRTATVQGRAVTLGLPYIPQPLWALGSNGEVIMGDGARYQILVLGGARPLRIERMVDPVPVAADEKQDIERYVGNTMRQDDPGWRWNGPEIPDVKPMFTRIFAGQDGRIWVQVPQPSVEIPAERRTSAAAFVPRWTEPIAFDVFDRAGRYLGQVNTPEGFQGYPYPVIRGDTVWAATSDALGVQRVVRFRVSEESE